MRTEPDRLLGEAPSFLKVLEEVSAVAPLEKPVLIVGERGTGKELIAARLHFLSNRWEGQFLKMNCAAISDSLLESELFGHEAGAFTGAAKTHRGRFERAHGGTLFLDELATTSTLVQEKLLRVIEYGEFERVGGNKTLYCDVRLVAATNDDLPRLAEQGKFRADLLDRLAFDVITLPPLREREADIRLLAEYFAITMASELERNFFPGFSARALEALNDYDWPGNVRELKNVVERAVYRSDPDDVVDEIVFDPFDSPFRPNVAQHQAADTVNPTSAAVPAAQLPTDLKESVRKYEIAMIDAALDEAKHNQRKAAELLGLTYHQFRGYLKKYDVLSS
ncbi:MAG: phage shock protein operon transcriptional activator [Pseudomonadales bacterium]|jgi:psp operon transcriptional activator|nr:phage shock protein operon transcriptional activator [Pseudomonadales bacterium]MDP6471734.1 phage shock protein operon transcriptional activator [Pseudomonadales bacterium]MDP6971434.1 phage shock protein operon transcriptional activator [Pseudomonadales bacterium]|tara:strand:- start:1386 stop:2396 length:1011 start_codon:yes stop_codon:yes gene_type:complete